MNAIYQMFLHLYIHIKEWLFPPKNLCSHCIPAPWPLPPGLEAEAVPPSTPITFSGGVVGFARGLRHSPIGVGSEGHSEQKHFLAASLLFKHDCLSQLFLNDCVIPESQKLAFDIELDGETHSVYLVHSEDPAYVNLLNDEFVRLDNATLETECS